MSFWLLEGGSMLREANARSPQPFALFFETSRVIVGVLR